MNKIFHTVALTALLALTACGGKEILRSQTHAVYVPDETKYPCRAITKLPKPVGLTDLAVANLINALYEANQQCYMSQKALFATLRAAQAEVGAGGTITASAVRRWKIK